MWPGQQPANGGEQNPQQPNPYQQPGYHQPNPYQQPGYQQPNPYAQPGGPQPGGPQPGGPQPGEPGGPQWTTLGASGGGEQPPEGGRNKRTTVIAIGAALAVVAAAVITGVVVLKDDDKKTSAKDDPKSSVSASAAGSASPSQSAAPEDNPRAGGGVPKPVINGWKVVVNPKRHNAFDVPPEWKVSSPDVMEVLTDESDKKSMFPKGLESMTAPATYKNGECKKYSSKAATGTKGAQGLKDAAQGAENEALTWVWAAFDQKKTGKFESIKGKPFKSDYGLTGQTASATVTGVKKTGECTTDGKAVTVTYKDVTGDYATWVLYSVKGDKDEVPEDTIKKIMSTLRPVQPS